MANEPLKVIAGAPDRPLAIGDIAIQCYVLEDESRVLTQRGVFTAFGASRGGSYRGGAEIPRFLESRVLSSYISSELRVALKTPIPFKLPEGGVAHGYLATLLPEICNVIQCARSDGKLTSRQRFLADRVDILMRGLATVGIIGLIDEATGYQALREKRALATFLEKFIAKELQKWIRTFPDEYYTEIFRLNRWDHKEGVKRPQIIGHYTNEIVYERLAPGVLEELRRLNPVGPRGIRRNRHHQWLTPVTGHPKLREHLAGVIALMQTSLTWPHFMQKVDHVYRKHGSQLTLLD